MSPEALGLTSVTNFGLNLGPKPVVSTTSHTQKKRIRLSKELHATQPYVLPGKVEGMPNRTPGKQPTIKTEDGVTYVLDGHHRIAKALKRGQKTITVNEYLSE